MGQGFYQSFLLWEKSCHQFYKGFLGEQTPKSFWAKGGFGSPFSPSFPSPDPATFFQPPAFDPQFVQSCFGQWQAYLKDHPELFQERSGAFYKDFLALVANSYEAIQNPETPPHISGLEGERFFSNTLWQDLPPHRFGYQLYLLIGSFLLQLLEESELSPLLKKQMAFWIKQGVYAASPANFPLGNPEVLQKSFETGGANFWKGWEKWVEDLQANPQEVFLKLTKSSEFKVGENLAVTPGKVVFQNSLFQLIQYKPLTKTVFKEPLLIVPPWINKFYLFDLSPQNSFVKWALEQGHAVFMISWVNPQGMETQKGFEEYLLQGVIPALEKTLQITRAPQANLMGLCIGGNLMACALSYLEKTQKPLVCTATLLATLMHFEEVGALEVFLNPQHFDCLKATIGHQGYMDGNLMAFTFSLLRAGEMIWTPFVRRYFLGEDPPPLDFLFWNADPQRIPGPLHLFCLKNFFQKNLLKQPGGITISGVPCDFSSLSIPLFTLASLKDHIAPWKGCFPLKLKSKDRFVLSSSGHIAGTINPPTLQKYAYWSGENTDEGPEAWLQKAQKTSGSWWPFWQKWVQSLSSKRVPAYQVGSSECPPLEEAPGSYVTAE